jgi:GNAT superfamily N-acetyltransferase
VVGYATYYFTYSTFLARPTLYLEDIFVMPSYRGRGAGRALFRACAAEAVRRGCGRMEWQVLDWNAPAIEFYQRSGARLLDDWRVCRLTGDALAAAAR